MNTIWYILLVILGISVLVITHELGHYLMGKALGFTIVEFSVGLGPKLFGIKGKETEFTLRALPIGGSCRFYGEDQEVQDERCFNSKPAWRRFLVVLAGPLTNILTCVVLAFVMLLGFGEVVDRSSDELLIVQEVVKGGPAEEAGVQVGDVIVAIDGKPLQNSDAVSEAVSAADLHHLELTVLRGAQLQTNETKDGRLTTTETAVQGGTELTLTLGDLLDQETGEKRIKVTYARPSVRETVETYSVGKAAYMAFPYTWDLGKLVYQSIGMIVTGKASFRDMTGIVGTVDFVSDTMAQTKSATAAVDLFLWFMALIAVNLGIVNLFPLPALDGGRLIFIIIEMIRRKPVPPEKEGVIHLVGMVLLLVLMVALTVSDIMRCFGG